MAGINTQVTTRSAGRTDRCTTAEPQGFRFLDLPPEVRHLIYCHLFSTSTIIAEAATVIMTWSDSDDVPDEETWLDDCWYLFTDATVIGSAGDADTPPKYYTITANCPFEILETCKTIYKEAKDLLPQCTRLTIEGPISGRAQLQIPLELSTRIQQKIPEIEYLRSLPKIPTKLDLFDNLKLITLVCQVHDLGSEISTSSDVIGDLAIDKVQRSKLKLEEVFQLEDGATVEVRMPVWLVDGTTTSCLGWNVEVDLRN